MSEWGQISVDEIGVILLVPGVELEDQAVVGKYPIISVAMLVIRECVGSEQVLIPSGACAYVADGD